MKLKNFMFATMIACAFASCSEDDAVIDNGPDPVTKGDANFTIVVNSQNMGTKAVKPEGSGETLKGETDIKNLTLVVFNSTGDFLASATGNTDGKVSIEGLAPQTIQFMVFANMSIAEINKLNSSTIYSQPLALGANGFNVTDGLPMSSNLVKDVALVSGNNYYGYDEDEMTNPAENGKHSVGTPLSLFRNVARVDLEAVKLSMADSEYESGEASFQYTGAYIENAANKALTNGGIASDAGFVTGSAKDYKFYANFVETPAIATPQTFTKDTERKDAVDVSSEKAYYYVLTNTQEGANVTPTKLVVRGNFSLTGAQKAGDDKTYTLASQEGFYPITVGVDGLTSAEKGLVRNKIYKITLLVAGPGRTSDGSGKATFFVKCTVANWDKVDQIHPVQ